MNLRPKDCPYHRNIYKMTFAIFLTFNINFERNTALRRISNNVLSAIMCPRCRNYLKSIPAKVFRYKILKFRGCQVVENIRIL